MTGGSDAKVPLEDHHVRIAGLEAALSARDALIAELKEQLAQSIKQNAQLLEKLNQNSSNSHQPPSSDGPGAESRGVRPKKSSKKPKRQRGGQKGHRGHHRKLIDPELVDSFVDLYPEVCLGCAAPLQPQLDPNARRYQQVDLCDHRPHVTEWRCHEIKCGRCGARTRAAHDRNIIPSLAFGPSLTGVVALLTGVYHLSRRQSQRLLHELFGIQISLGALSAMEHRTSRALKSAYTEAKKEVEHAAVKHSDATAWLRCGVLRSLWTLASATATVYAIFMDGRRETVRPFFGAQEGILVSDRASVFTFWKMSYRQVCWSHLMRKFISFSERDGPKGGAFGRELLDYTALVFEYWHGYRDGILTRDELETWLQPVQWHFERTLKAAAGSGIEEISGSCLDILAHREALWTFVTHEGVEPTNNHAELELRPFVLWRKRCFGSRSDRGDRFAERVMTIARTARKQGKSVLQFINNSVTAYIGDQTPPQLIGTA